MEVVTALREHLKLNPLPSEAQQIDRFLERFAEKITSPSAVKPIILQPEEFPQGKDSLFIFLFSLLMLNTDLHKAAKITDDAAASSSSSDKPKTNGGWGSWFMSSSSSKSKAASSTTPKHQHLTLDQFEKQLLGIVSFSKEDLRDVYEDIREVPLV